MTTSGARDLKDWEAEHADRIVTAINQLRDRYGWTIPRLGVELALFGWEPSRETLNGILSGRKRKSFSVAEVFAFARAFRVSPSYLLAGLPDATDLPAGPLVPQRDVASVFDWVSDREFRALGGSPATVLVKYAEHLGMARWHNALWCVAPERFVGGSLVESLKLIALERERWRDYADNGFHVPSLPALPPELVEMGLDEWQGGDPNVLYRSLRSVLVDPLPASFSGDELMEEARHYVKRLEVREAELRDLEARGGLSGPATHPAE